MVNIDTGLFVASSVAGDRSSASMARRVLSSLFVNDSVAGVPKPGVLQNGGNPFAVQTASTSALTFTINPGYAMLVRTAAPTLGGYLAGSAVPVTFTLAAANASNPRIDTVYICQPDPEAGDSTHARIDVLQGTPAASPSAPAASGLPQGSLALFNVTVPAGATAASACTITDTRTYTALQTGLPVYPNIGALPANGGAYGALALVQTFTLTGGAAHANVTMRWNGTAWKPWESEWQAVNFTVVNGFVGGYNAANGWNSNGAQFRFRGGRACFRGNIFAMGNGAVNDQINIGLPHTASTFGGTGQMQVMDASQGTVDYIVFGFVGATTLYSGATNAGNSKSNPTGPNIPFAWAQGDQLRWNIEYDPA